MRSQNALIRIIVTILIFCLCLPVIGISEEKDYSYLQDMTVRELRELRDEINKLLGDEPKEDNANSPEAGLLSLLGVPDQAPAQETEYPEDDLEYEGWSYHFVEYKVEKNKATGKKDIRVIFDCTNNSGRANSPHMSIRSEAYQNGIALERPSSLDTQWGSVYEHWWAPDIQSGNTIRVAFVSQLNDSSSDVTFELQNWGISQTKLRKVLSLTGK